MNTARTSRLDRALNGLWYASSAPQTLMALVMLLAGTLAFAAIIPQQPASLDAAASERWLTTAAAAYRGAGPFLRAIDAFGVLSSPWLRALLAALAFNLALRVVAQGRVVRRLWRRAEVLPAPPGLPTEHARIPGVLETLLARAEDVLRITSPGVAVEREGSHAQLYAGGHRAGLCGPLLTYVGGLLILIGLLVNDTAGWRKPDIALAPGSTAVLAQAAQLQVTLNTAAGEGTGATANVTVARAAAGKTVDVGFAWPAFWGNVWLAQQATGPALSITAQGSDNRPLLLQSLAEGSEVDQNLHVLFQQTQGEQGFAVPARNLTFRTVSYPGLPERNIQRPVFLVEGYRGTDPAPVLTELVEDKATLTLDGISLAVQRSLFVTLEVAYLPGLIPLLLGCLLMVAGVMLSVFLDRCAPGSSMAVDQDAVVVAGAVAASVEPQREAARLLQALRPEPVAAEPDHEG